MDNNRSAFMGHVICHIRHRQRYHNRNHYRKYGNYGNSLP